MSYQIQFVRDDQVVGYLGREGMDTDIMREDKREAIDMFDLKACVKRVQELKKVRLPPRLQGADPRSLMMFHFVVGDFEMDHDENRLVAKFGEKYQIKVISAATGGAVETHQYVPQ